MPLRIRALLLAAGLFVVVPLLWFLFLWRPSRNEIAELQRQQEAARAQQQQLEAQLSRLRQLQADEPRLRSELARLEDALPGDPNIPDFILQIQEAANLSGIPFFSISPSPPAASTAAAPGGGALQVVSVSISVQGRFFELQDFITRLERLSRAVRVNSFGLSGTTTDGTSPTMSVGFAIQIFVSPITAAPAAAAPAPAPAPAPGPATPVPPTTTTPAP